MCMKYGTPIHQPKSIWHEISSCMCMTFEFILPLSSVAAPKLHVTLTCAPSPQFFGHFICKIAMDKPKRKRTLDNTETWIIGSGTASLASALYLIKHFRIQPSRVHILDAHASLEEASHHEGNASGGYDQFAGCLPVPGGLPMRELLAMVPSAELQGQSILEEIQMSQAGRDPANENNHTSFLTQKNGTMKDISTRPLNLTIRHRMSLTHFLLKREKSLVKRQIHDFFPDSFFESAFWTVLSAQCVFGRPYKIIPLDQF